jgi:hypothetical protein
MLTIQHLFLVNWRSLRPLDVSSSLHILQLYELKVLSHSAVVNMMFDTGDCRYFEYYPFRMFSFSAVRTLSSPFLTFLF